MLIAAWRSRAVMQAGAQSVSQPPAPTDEPWPVMSQTIRSFLACALSNDSTPGPAAIVVVSIKLTSHCDHALAQERLRLGGDSHPRPNHDAEGSTHGRCTTRFHDSPLAPCSWRWDDCCFAWPHRLGVCWRETERDRFRSCHAVRRTRRLRAGQACGWPERPANRHGYQVTDEAHAVGIGFINRGARRDQRL